jgi:hypothetical protein
MLPALDEQHQEIERPTGRACDGPDFPHGA